MLSDTPIRMVDVLHHLEKLVAFPSITPNSSGSLEYIGQVLSNNGFIVINRDFENNGEITSNLYAVYGNGKPNICFAGHVDVVPAGDLASWYYNPFMLSIVNDKVYGRGVVDMKGAIACAIATSLQFIECNKNFNGAISFLLTSDEEGKAINGTKAMLPYIQEKGHIIDFCILGEPTSEKQIGDVVKIGRRGSVNFSLTVQGEQGHVAYPHLARNPIHELISIMNELVHLRLDKVTHEMFLPSHLEITSFDVNNLVSNIIPNKAKCQFNIRFNITQNIEQLVVIIKTMIKQYTDHYELDYVLSADSFIQTISGELLKFCEIAYNAIDIMPKFSTSGGTSDARFLKDYCKVVEYGLVSSTAHKINECTTIRDLQKLSTVYYQFLESTLG